jgi:hypothetical protein
VLRNYGILIDVAMVKGGAGRIKPRFERRRYRQRLPWSAASYKASRLSVSVRAEYVPPEDDFDDALTGSSGTSAHTAIDWLPPNEEDYETGYNTGWDHALRGYEAHRLGELRDVTLPGVDIPGRPRPQLQDFAPPGVDFPGAHRRDMAIQTGAMPPPPPRPYNRITNVVDTREPIRDASLIPLPEQPQSPMSAMDRRIQQMNERRDALNAPGAMHVGMQQAAQRSDANRRRTRQMTEMERAAKLRADREAREAASIAGRASAITGQMRRTHDHIAEHNRVLHEVAQIENRSKAMNDSNQVRHRPVTRSVTRANAARAAQPQMSNISNPFGTPDPGAGPPPSSTHEVDESESAFLSLVREDDEVQSRLKYG